MKNGASSCNATMRAGREQSSAVADMMRDTQAKMDPLSLGLLREIRTRAMIPVSSATGENAIGARSWKAQEPEAGSRYPEVPGGYEVYSIKELARHMKRGMRAMASESTAKRLVL